MFDSVTSTSKNDFIWAYMYAPKKLSDLVLLDRHVPQFEKIVQSKHLPDTLLFGPPGAGKTSLCNVLINEIGFDVLKINGSVETSIDVIRTDVKNFTRRSSSKPKLVFIDEMERISPNGQDALKAEIETCTKTSFIFTSNHREKIIEPLISRCGGGISFYYSSDEKKELQKKYFKRAVEILKHQEVDFDQRAVAKVVQHYFPDMRNTIHKLQEIFNQTGEIKQAAVESALSTNLDEFFELIKGGEFDKIRTWCANISTDPVFFYLSIANKAEKFVSPDAIGDLIAQCYEHQKTTSVSADKTLPLIHFCMSIMSLDLL